MPTNIERLCEALKLLERVSEAYVLTSIGENVEAENKLKYLYPELVSHMQTSNRPSKLSPILDNANRKYLMAKHADYGSNATFIAAVDVIKDRIHQDATIRNFFLGGRKVAPEVKLAVSALGGGEPETALEILASIDRKTHCSTAHIKKPRSSTTLYYHRQGKGT